MTQLTDTQLVILSTACGRDDRLVFLVTASLKGGALNKVLQSLLAKGFIEETAAEAGTTVWRDEDEGPVTLRATHAAAVALGVESETETPAPAEASQAADEPAAAERKRPRPTPRGSPQAAGERRSRRRPGRAVFGPHGARGGRGGLKVRAGTKQALLIEMLRRPEGTSIDEVMTATGWQAHTVRGAMAGALRRSSASR